MLFGGAPSEYLARGLEALHIDYISTLRVILQRSQNTVKSQGELSEERRDVDILFENRQRIRHIKRELELYGR